MTLYHFANGMYGIDSGGPYSHRKAEKEAACIDFLTVIIASGIALGRVRPTWPLNSSSNICNLGLQRASLILDIHDHAF